MPIFSSQPILAREIARCQEYLVPEKNVGGGVTCEKLAGDN